MYIHQHICKHMADITNILFPYFYRPCPQYPRVLQFHFFSLVLLCLFLFFLNVNSKSYVRKTHLLRLPRTKHTKPSVTSPVCTVGNRTGRSWVLCCFNKAVAGSRSCDKNWRDVEYAAQVMGKQRVQRLIVLTILHLRISVNEGYIA